VHREELIVEVRPDDVVLRPCELQPHGNGGKPAQEQEDEDGDDVAPADHLVVDAGQPADQTRGGAPRLGETAAQLDIVKRGVAQLDMGTVERNLAHFNPSR
jgi:hypothetical protein